jgi:hypothetical protein
MLETNRKRHNAKDHPDLCIVRLGGDGSMLVLKKADDRYNEMFDCPLCSISDMKSTIAMQKHFDKDHGNATMEHVPAQIVLTSSQTSVPQDNFPPSDCEEEAIQCSLLQSINCVFNTAYRLIICMECRHAIDPLRMEDHAANHGHIISEVDCDLLRLQHLPMGRASFQEMQPDLHDAILGIEIKPRGLWCGFPGCGTARSTKESLRDHCKKAHPGQQATKLSSLGPVQLVFGPGTRCTRVNPVIHPDEVGDRAAAYLRTFPKPQLEPIDTDSEKQLNPLLRATKWHLFYEEIGQGQRATTKQVYYRLSHFAGRADEQSDMKKLFRMYANYLRVFVENCAILPLKWINTKQ